MSRAELTPFSYVVLALVGRGGAGAHDLVRMSRQGQLYWAAADSQYYAEPKRLAKLGYLDARKQPGKTRERTHYTLTAAGLEALRAWLAESAHFPRIQHEGAIKVMAGDLAGDDVVVGSLQGLKTELAELSARLDEAEQRLAGLPHRERYLRLNHRLARRILQAHVDWLADVERELG